MIKVLIVIVVAVVVVFLLKRKKNNSTDEYHNNKRPDASLKSTKFVENDKIVIIKHTDSKVYQKAITEFCNIYNQENYRVGIKFYIFEDEFIAIFPYDIDFVAFCFFINYMKYGMMGFAMGEESKKLDRPAFMYQKNNFDMSKLQNSQFIEFE